MERVAPFFRDRFTNMRWSILTPERCVHWEGSGELWFSAGANLSHAPSGDALEHAWRIYYQNIFNPARVKWNAMRSEMPQKYWQHLPEAALIPQLMLNADERVAVMGKQKPDPTLKCGARPESPEDQLANRIHVAAERAPRLEQLRLAASACRGCPRWEPATQTVFGTGPDDAAIMLVGEQPGDEEDLAGEPFVGPAGRLLNDCLQDAGLTRDAVYLTNAVKHFGFRARGKRRLHERPREGTIYACQEWLDAELTVVQPLVVVCLGRTARLSLLGEEPLRGEGQHRAAEQRNGRWYLSTVHPALPLRLGGPSGAAAKAELVEALTAAKALVDDAEAVMGEAVMEEKAAGEQVAEEINGDRGIPGLNAPG